MGADESVDSFRHSCGTLAGGVEYMNLSLEEQHLQKQLQAAIGLQYCQPDNSSSFNRWCFNWDTHWSRQELEDQLQEPLVGAGSCESLVVRIWVFIIHHLKSSSLGTITNDLGFIPPLLRPHLQRPSALWKPKPSGSLESSMIFSNHCPFWEIDPVKATQYIFSPRFWAKPMVPRRLQASSWPLAVQRWV